MSTSDAAPQQPGFLDTVWKWPWLGYVVLCASALLGIYWWFLAPAPGKAIAVLAVLAAAMTFRTEASGLEKTFFMLIAAGFLFVEMEAIDTDRRAVEAAAKLARQEDQQNFQNLLDQERWDNELVRNQEQQGFNDTLEQTQTQFQQTLDELVNSETKEREQFSRVLGQQERLYAHEEKLADSLDGTLEPGHEPTPANGCDNMPPQWKPSGTVQLMYGTRGLENTSLISNFPHTVLEVENAMGTFSAIALDKAPDGKLRLLLDLRDRDGKIIARLNREGFVVNRNKVLEIKRETPSTLEIIDEYGQEVLAVHYWNPTAISMNGQSVLQNFTRGCIGGTARADIHIRQ